MSERIDADLEPQRPDGPARETPRLAFVPRRRRRVLIVDDSEGVRALLRRLLEHWGYVCEEADGGRPALARLELEAFSLVLTDFDMPDGDGLTLIRDLRQRAGVGRSTPVILISGSATDEVCDEAIAAGARAVFRKPFQPGLLREMIDLVVDTRER
jgi:two-component system chemotaxis response regulator CheY